MNSLIQNPFSVSDFDKAVRAFYEGNGATRHNAQLILTEFQSHSDSWQLVDQILEQSTSPQAKFIALGILEDFIVLRWNTLPIEQRLVMRNYIAKTILDLSTNESTLRSEKTYINKLDVVLVQILKKDWPQYWPTFIQEIIDSSSNNVNICENNMKILKLLSEEVFDFSEDHLTMAKIQKLKNQMVNEFESVFTFCKRVLSASTSLNLTIATLETLLKFIGWIPVQFVYQNDLVAILESNLSGLPVQRNLALQCFTEMISLELVDQQYNDIITSIYSIVSRAATRNIPENVDIAQIYEASSNEDQQFIEVLSIFLTTFLPKYRTLIESIGGNVHTILQYLLKISRVPEREVWKTCLEYWGKFTYDIVQDLSHDQPTPYEYVIKELGLVMIDNMVEPDDVLVIKSDDGDVTREFIKQSDTTALSKNMRDVFSSITNLNPAYVHSMIHDKLVQVSSSAEWSWDELFRISWAIGSISGAISEEQENLFLESIVTKDIVDLLKKEETLRPNSDREWVVASCLLYIAGQYTGFLKSHWNFLSFLLQKIFDYMKNEQKGVREMACDYFLKLCQGCGEEFSIPHQNTPSILESVLGDLRTITAHLDSQQMYLVYEAIGNIIFASPTTMQQQSLMMLMAIPNDAITAVSNNFVTDVSTLKSIITILKTNIATCKPVGPLFRTQLQNILPFLNQCYEITSPRPDDSQKQLKRLIRQLILELVEMFVLSNERLESQDQLMLSDLIQSILVDYKSATEVGEPKVLSLLTSLFEKMQDPIWPDLLKQVVDVEFVCTLPLITSNFVDHPDFRHEFYRLLRVLNRRCFIELFQSPELFKVVIDSIMWGTKHTIRDISQIALQICLDMINSVSQLEDEDVASQFFETFYVRILTDILEILVDPDCRNGFNYQSQVLARMFELVQEGEIYTRLFDPNQVSNPLMSNVEFLQQYTLELLCNAFPLLQRDQIEVLVMGMFEYSGDLQRFQNDIRDFLIDIREVEEEGAGAKRAQEEINAELELLRDL